MPDDFFLQTFLSFFFFFWFYSAAALRFMLVMLVMKSEPALVQRVVSGVLLMFGERVEFPV